MITYLLFAHLSVFVFFFFHLSITSLGPSRTVISFFGHLTSSQRKARFFFSPALKRCVNLNLMLTFSEPDSTSTGQNLRLDLKWQRRPCLQWLNFRKVVLPDVTETMPWSYRSANLVGTVFGFRIKLHPSFLMECGQVTHLSGPQFPQKGEKKTGLKKTKIPSKSQGFGGGVGGAVDFSMTLFALHPCLMKPDRCSQFSDEPAGAQEN